MRATILCYHKVGPAAEEGRRLNVEPARLRSHVAFFARRRRPFVRAADLAAPWPEGAVCFTFDDAYASTMANAPAILESFGARGTFYAVAGKVGGASDWDGPAARPLAPLEALLDAQARGHEIGNHTFSHPHLDQLAPEAQAREVDEADAWLRERGLEPGSFCYPYGGYDADAIRAAARYPVALALRKRLATSEDDPHALPRVVVAYGDALPLLLYRLYIRPRLRRTPLR
jgi:peptidoglycan/xylan/chitin deacetylase (PgdA/CDA1 family)